MGAPKGNKNALGNKGGGDKTDYKPEYATIAYQMTLLGATDAEMADALGKSETTINAWKHSHVEFAKALTRGKLYADAHVADRLHQRACGYSHDAVKVFMPAGATEPVYAPYTEHYPPDTAALSLWLRNRQSGKWRDKVEQEITIKGELAERLDDLRKRRTKG